MQQFTIRFNNEKDKVNFVREAERKKYDIDLKHGSKECDGKSLVGVISTFDLNTDVTMIVNTEEYGIEYDFKYWII